MTLAVISLLLAGAVGETHPHWAFQPVGRPARQNIDSLVAARLQKEGLRLSPPADKRTLLRRLSLDLTGLPPTPEEMASFLSDNRADAYERQVDRLLASPHFAEKWARHWLDQARYADSDGYEKDWFRPYAWRYRDWVIQSIHNDQPFDEFTIEQLAGDLLPRATVEQRVATGFLRMTLTNREGGISNEQFRFENTLDRASTLGAVWLGLTVGCAQCHDHKYDPITQKDLYSLTAFFDNVEEVDIDAPRAGETGPWLAKAAEYRAKREALLKDYNVAALQREWEGWMRFAIENPGKKTDLDLAWDCVLKLTEGGDGGKILQTPPEKRTRREQDILTDHFIRNYHFAVGGHRYEQTNFRQLDAKLRKLKEDSYPLTQAMVVAEEGAARKTHVKIRGDWKADGPEVAPVTPAVLPPLRSEGRASRLDLARWLVARENPLTARVTVNRIWQELFGAGLVRTAEDFGTRSERPVHPELLDWLAAEFMDNGWSRKQLIRTIVTSAVYRQSSQVSPALFQKDPLNTLLARQSRQRLPAELLRDSALAVGGLLSPKVGGPSIRPPQPNGVMELGYGQKVGANWDDSKGEDRYRRGLYVQFLRTTPYPLLVNFDAPKGNVAACRRERSNTPLQALNLLNDPVFFEAAQGFAQRILARPAQGFRERLEFAFETALGRGPSATESTRLQAYLEKQTAILEREKDSAARIAPWAASPQEAAAWTALASVVLNLDEFITRE